ncbi:TetR/AcrR family transcriptional regulator [Antrihabitans cavernicola]|uniref:TetR/AcrR family transcriptional regulator n=1 Tax=Antrihabitans cavernicola TaxID=2495913 RepID=A0A5A7S4A5_9NOCA|nr:TetR/AcrR family transcriptional regulator [Spelaeibacter cavernicola]KAA0016766.1 TetR/AcrR family transcriptional regulator [Spelaeibacter cavernicola]
MARQQERARRTRAAIIGSAAVEFGKSGYSAASLNRILEGSHATKGAMYFHFDSKEDLARAVMETALERYAQTTDRWMARGELEPFEILHGMLDELALRFQTDAVVQAEFRLIIEPEFYSDVQSGGGSVWGKATYVLATRAKERGMLRADTDPEKFTRMLAAVTAGQRYMTDLLSERDDLRSRFEEGFGVILEAMATPEWLERWKRTGWQFGARIEDVDTGS